MDILFVFICILVIYFFQRKYLNRNLNNTNTSKYFFDILFIVHHIFFLLYYIYSTSKRSDSFYFYEKTLQASSWVSLWGNGTTFIRFLTYPFSNLLHLSFPAISLIFSFFGFQGMAYFYLATKENIQNSQNIFFNLSIVEILFLLPNCHFWSSSLGKGSIMIFALSLFFYSLSKIKRRILPFLCGLSLVLFIRPHIIFIFLISVCVGIVFDKKTKIMKKLLIFSVSILFALSIFDYVSSFIKSDFINIFLENSYINEKALRLSNSTSGYNVTNYNQGLKIFTFLFRPLFIDSPNVLGTIISIENLFYFFLFIHTIYLIFIGSNKMNSFILVSFVFFLFASIFLAQVCGNLGMAVRQKAQIMPIFFIVYANLVVREKKVSTIINLSI